MLLANKQDLPNALSKREIAEKFNIRAVKQTLYVEAVTATTGDGLAESFDWLATQLRARKQSRWDKTKENLFKYTSYIRCTTEPQEQITE